MNDKPTACLPWVGRDDGLWLIWSDTTAAARVCRLWSETYEWIVWQPNGGHARNRLISSGLIATEALAVKSATACIRKAGYEFEEDAS
mgnify:CR=1 FL=1